MVDQTWGGVVDAPKDEDEALLLKQLSHRSNDCSDCTGGICGVLLTSHYRTTARQHNFRLPQIKPPKNVQGQKSIRVTWVLKEKLFQSVKWHCLHSSRTVIEKNQAL